MSVSSQTEQSPKFTDMKELQRWLGEREDRLHREQVIAKLVARDQVAEREKQQRTKKNPTLKSPKSNRKKTSGDS